MSSEQFLSAEALPSLDCHAHIAADVTRPQLAALGSAVVFAVTRTLKEAQSVIQRADSELVWGCGVHPASKEALSAFDADKLEELLERFALVGEVGLDRRAGDLPKQRDVFREVLRRAHDKPVLISVHSAGCSGDVLALLTEAPHPGVILHWFLGDGADIAEAVALGCFFSVNAAMSEQQLRNIPLDRMLPETDFPASRKKTGARVPGDVATLETTLSALTREPVPELRLRWFRNLRRLALQSGAIDRLPERVADLLLPL